MKNRLSRNKKYIKIIGIAIILLALPLTLILVRQIQDTRSSAASPDKLETESGVLSSTGVTKQSDSGASGGNYVLFANQPPTNTPNPTSLPSTSGNIYGSGVTSTTLANTKLGGNGARRTTMRFKAEQSSQMNSFKLYWLTPSNSPSGYAQGTGGIIKFTLETEDNNEHPSGNILASRTVNISQEIGGNTFATISFANPPSLNKDQFYHLVATNIDSNPSVNNMSLDYIWNRNWANENLHPQPKYSDNNYAHYMNDSLTGGTWVMRPGYLSIIDITFGNGAHQGMGYMEASYSSYDQVGKITGSLLVREKITVGGGDKNVVGAAIKVQRDNGGSPLTVKLKQGSSTLAQFQIPASQVPAGHSDPVNGPAEYDPLGGDTIWIEKSFGKTITLVNGNTYSLELSAPSDTEYYIWTNRSGVANYGFAPVTVFSDGGAEYSTNNGSSWGVLGRVKGTSPNQNNLQSFLRLSSN